MQRQEVRFAVGLGAASVVDLGLIVFSSLGSGQVLYPFLAWNLCLAWLPLIFSYWLRNVLKRKRWSSWEAIILTVAWLMLLPNSFYMVSDLVHLVELEPSQILYGAVVFTGFILTSLCLGVTSLYLMHQEFLKRVSSHTAAAIVGVLLLVCSLAIYIGRDLRWNSWDVVVNPFGLLFDLSDRLLHPSEYGAALSVVLPFFTLLGLIYFATWQLVLAVKATQR